MGECESLVLVAGQTPPGFLIIGSCSNKSTRFTEPFFLRIAFCADTMGARATHLPRRHCCGSAAARLVAEGL